MSFQQTKDLRELQVTLALQDLLVPQVVLDRQVQRVLQAPFQALQGLQEPLEAQEPLVLLDRLVLQALRAQQVLRVQLAHKDHKVFRELLDQRGQLVLQVALDPQVHKERKVFKASLDRQEAQVQLVLLVVLDLLVPLVPLGLLAVLVLLGQLDRQVRIRQSRVRQDRRVLLEALVQQVRQDRLEQQAQLQDRQVPQDQQAHKE